MWLVVLVVICGVAYFFANGSRSKTMENASEQRSEKYTDRLADDFHFSTDHTMLLNEIQLFCYEIACDNAYMKYSNRSFEYSMMLEVDVLTRKSSGEFVIQPGGDWDNDFNILDSIEGKRTHSLAERCFEILDDGHGLIYRSDAITGLIDRLGLDKGYDEGFLQSAIKVGFDSIVRGWSSAHDNNRCEIVKADIFDYRKTSGKILMHITYRYSYMG